MINQESKLKLQAYLDHELSPREAEQITAWLSQDTQAKALHAELSDIKALLEGNELEMKVPESREFYWSKIERGIRQEDPVYPRQSTKTRYPWWLRIFAPAAGLAVVLFLALTAGRFTTSPPTQSYVHEIETPLEETSTITFHSQSAGVAVVWVQSRLY